MKKNDKNLTYGEVKEWLDCGNKNATLHTNKRVLEINKDIKQTRTSLKLNNSVIIEPCFIGNNIEISNSIVGPHVSIGDNTKILNTILSDSIVQSNTNIENTNIENSMIGNYADIKGTKNNFNFGDYISFSQGK